MDLYVSGSVKKPLKKKQIFIITAIDPDNKRPDWVFVLNTNII